MPFIESSESVRSRAHVSGVPTTALVGVLVLAGIALVIFVGNVVSAASGAVFELESKTGHESSTASSSVAESSSQEASEGQRVSEVYVFVSGAVAKPGVYCLSGDARVNDAIESAGGFVEGAATDYNNLARGLVDGEHIHVPTNEELTSQGSQASAPSASQAAVPGAGPATGGLVNINTASAEELESLPGIGPATANKIVASRETDGPFSTPDELMRVSGIGEKKYAAVADLICV